MNRRGFLGSILALGAAPAIVRADSLMRIVPVDTDILFLDQSRTTGTAILNRLWRREAQAALVEWWMRELDGAMYRTLSTADGSVLLRERAPIVPFVSFPRTGP